MKKARIVVGSNCGDEGKGTIVAKYSKGKQNVLNILTNGGAQRGHSIVTENGAHTFHHFGSGTLHGAATHYSHFFILNPMQFRKEWDELIVKPMVYRDMSCKWSTPFDMIANSIEEETKGTHASCRMGIWNTIVRTKEQTWIAIDSFVNLPFSTRLKTIDGIKTWYENRITIPDKWKEIWNNPFLVTNFLEDCKFLVEHTVAVRNTNDERILKFDSFIFENGQGLLIGGTGKNTSDTTPSDTGSTYSKILLNEMGLDESVCETTIHYVTRPYLTRHGDGFLSQETSRQLISQDIKEDRTNVYNEGQGEFRHGKLDIAKLKSRIIKDAGNTNFIVELTHVDEMDREKEFRNVFEKVETTESPIV